LGGAERQDALLVAITRDGQVWFDRDRIMAENLPAAIRERVSRGDERKVYLRADMRARYGGVVRVLACERAAGIEKVGFVVKERNSRPTRLRLSSSNSGRSGRSSGLDRLAELNGRSPRDRH
jgi:biopolymer transport protein ExbD/biopolymer transport protein TolR